MERTIIIMLTIFCLSPYYGAPADSTSEVKETGDEDSDPFFHDFKSPLEPLERMHIDPIRSSLFAPLARMFQMFDPMVPPSPFSQFENPALRGFQRSRLNALNSGLGNMAGFVSSIKTNPDGSMSHVGLQFSQVAYPCGDKVCTNLTYVNSTSPPAATKETTTEIIDTSAAVEQDPENSDRLSGHGHVKSDELMSHEGEDIEGAEFADRPKDDSVQHIKEEPQENADSDSAN